MPSTMGKRRGNQTYYYLVESTRVDSKPRIASQQHLGSTDEMTAKLTDQQPRSPVPTQHKGFGNLAANSDHTDTSPPLGPRTPGSPSQPL